MNLIDFKTAKKHPRHGRIYIQAHKKNGRTWIFKQNGESFDIPTDEIEDLQPIELVAMYVNKTLHIGDASNLSMTSLITIAVVCLKNEEDKDKALQIAKVLKIELDID